jgi:hypothetical protein
MSVLCWTFGPFTCGNPAIPEHRFPREVTSRTLLSTIHERACVADGCDEGGMP